MMERERLDLSQEVYQQNLAALKARQAAELASVKGQGQNTVLETKRRHSYEYYALWLEHSGKPTENEGLIEWRESEEGQLFFASVRNGELVQKYGHDRQEEARTPTSGPPTGLERDLLDKMLSEAGVTSTTQPSRRNAGRGRSGR